MLDNFTEKFPYEKDDLIQKMAYTEAGLAEYIGLARPGTADDTAGWQIQKLTYDEANRLVSKLFAGGHNDYLYVWDDRETLDYA